MDFIFVNHIDEFHVNSSDPLIIPEDRFHPTLCLRLPRIIFTPNSRKYAIANRKELNFSKTDNSKLSSMLCSIDWNNILIASDLTCVLQKFYSVLLDFIFETVPFKFIRELRMIFADIYVHALFII